MTSLAVDDGFDPARRLPLRKRLSLVAEVFTAYVATRRSLSRRGLPATLASARETPRRGYGTPSLDARYLGFRLGRIVERVLRFLPDARCLTRSVVLIRLLRRRGISATLVIGVSPAPEFRAHAWVELEGVALLPAHESEYSRLTEL